MSLYNRPVSGTVDPSQVQSSWWFAHSTGSPRFKALYVAACHWRFELWDCAGCTAARSSSRSSLIPSFEDCSFHSSRVSRKCRRLRLYAVHCAVGMLYDLGVHALFVTLVRSHVFRVGFSIRTVWCGDRCASSLAVWSWYDFYPS